MAKTKEIKKDKKSDKNNEKLIQKKSPIDIILILMMIISSIYLIYNLLFQLGDIEKIIRYIVVGILTLIDLLLISKLLKKNNNKKRRLKKGIKRFFLFILIAIYLFLGININIISNKIGNMNKKYVTQSSSMVTLKSNPINNPKKIYNAKIAIGSNTESEEEYIIPMKIINKYNLKDQNNTLIPYDDYQSMIRDLYIGEVDYIFLPTNYGVIYGQMDEYETIEEDTKIIATKEMKQTKEESNLLGSSKSIKEPFTILLLGVDAKSNGIKNADSFNGDAIIMVTFNPKTLTATMLSIPRDTYIPISCFNGGAENKITHAASRGTKCVINTLQNYTGINIDYYAKINFKGLVDLVNALGGIEVDVPYAFCEQNSKRQFGKHMVYVDAGKQTLNGEQALALSRNRKIASQMSICPKKYLGGVRNDFVRGQNQQLVLRGILKKAKSVKNIDKVYEILDAISNNLDTNMEKDTILSFYNVAKDIITTSKVEDDEIISIQKLYLQGSDQYIYDERSRLVLYDYIPNQRSKELVVNAMKENLGLTKETEHNTFKFSVKQPYSQDSIGKYPGIATKLYTLVPNLKKYTRTGAESWARANGVTLIVKEQKTSQYNTGAIISQSEPESKRVDLIKNRTITIVVAVNDKNSQNTLG